MGVVMKMRRHGVKRPRMVKRVAASANLPLEYALAMLENETGIPQNNIFGCDMGPRSTPPYCNQQVTKDRVKKLLANGVPNGVGWTQLTWLPFVREAETMGGAHRPRNQMRVGFRVLRSNMVAKGVHGGFKAYNGTGPAAEAYADRAVARARIWKDRLDL